MGGATGAIARTPRCTRAPRDELYLFQIKYSNGGNCPDTPLHAGPPWWTLFVSNKVLVWKTSWFRSDTRIRLYLIFLCWV